MMITDAPPRKATHHAGFLESDLIRTLDLPQDGRLRTISQPIESAMKTGTTVNVRRACAKFLDVASDLWKALPCGTADLDRVCRVGSQRDCRQTNGEEATDEMEPAHRPEFPRGSHSGA
jgi:hypothetical protein